jgi:hypothetical protein
LQSFVQISGKNVVEMYKICVCTMSAVLSMTETIYQFTLHDCISIVSIASQEVAISS